jgi:hypothetical protein
MVKLARPLQPENALEPIDVTEFGITMLVSPLQPMKAHSPMEMTELGIVTLVNLVKLYAK